MTEANEAYTIETRERLIKLETTLTDFINTSNGVIKELQKISKENLKLSTALNNRLELLEAKFQDHVDQQERHEKRNRWAFSILVPALVASGIEFINLLATYGKM